MRRRPPRATLTTTLLPSTTLVRSRADAPERSARHLAGAAGAGRRRDRGRRRGLARVRHRRRRGNGCRTAARGDAFPGRLAVAPARPRRTRSEEHTSELQSLMRISYAVFCLKKKKKNK